MDFNPINLVATLVGGLLLAGLLGWIRKPRLVVLVSRQFSYSQISDRGQLLELSVLNRGFKTEDTVEVTLNNALRYDLLGSNSQDASVADNKIRIPRIGPSDDVTVLLLVEGGTFKKDDVVQCLSKETKAVHVSKLEEVPLTGPQRISVIGLFVAVPALLYAFSLGLDFLYESTKGRSSTAEVQSASIEVQGWKIPRYYETTSPQLLGALRAGKIQLNVGPPSRKGDIVALPVTLTNQTDEVLNGTLNMNTAQSTSRFKSYELTADGIVLTPGKTVERTVRVVVPEKAASRAERTVYIDLHLKAMGGGGSLSLSTQHEVR
jgi:hypothetical protein